MGFCDSSYHVINVAIVENNLKPQFSIIFIARSGWFDVCKAILTLIKNIAGKFIRLQKVLLAYDTVYLFYEIFSGRNNTCVLFISLEETHETWFKDCEDKALLGDYVWWGLFEANPINLIVTVNNINGDYTDI